MSMQAVHEFVTKVNGDPELSAQVVQAISRDEGAEVVDIAGKLGFAFSREEGQKLWDELLASGELPDALLDAVAGGGAPQVCANTSL